jgi:hypothetical protein
VDLALVLDHLLVMLTNFLATMKEVLLHHVVRDHRLTVIVEIAMLNIVLIHLLLLAVLHLPKKTVHLQKWQEVVKNLDALQVVNDSIYNGNKEEIVVAVIVQWVMIVEIIGLPVPMTIVNVL